MLKVIYLLVVTVVTFVLPALSATHPLRWAIVPALIALQVLTLLICRISISEIVRPAWRLKWLFLFLIGCYTLLPPEHPAEDLALHWQVPGVGWLVPFNVTGLDRAAVMCLQILTVLLASTVVRLTGRGDDLVHGLQQLRLPGLFVYSLDRTLSLLSGADGRSGRRQREAGAQPGTFTALKRLLRGDVGSFVQSIKANMELAAGQSDEGVGPKLEARLAHDVAVVSGIALCMASFKMLKILPGLPFASGHKALLLFPLYVLAARLTHSRWGATAAGAIMGVIGFLQGDGRFGVLEVLKHIAPGLVIDLAYPLVRRLPVWALGYCLLGLVAAVARTSTELVLVFLLGARAEIYLFPAAKLVPNLLAGFLSGFVTMFVLRVFSREAQVQDGSAEARDGEAPLKPDRAEAAQNQSKNATSP
ncbi:MULTISPECIES: energy-coupling factor transporter transmembrane component T [unclassified Bradyrhizobium]|uniref:energy-coupling factor transporter transmembrane component T n=1 Tax=unclassified Bradyrhizobium TaxID=2631580 RepID=UPI00247958CB|nr:MULTISPECIES: energy-coupling factor transporter transmembrane component T [unclassified Bradyrhizobium]WGS23538.1 energy-coupling factor transporter transmembrane protein EcfT [Bradyrhizobium sp. ISRA463]WGS30563.1 energy-coupling factor transporter transmembrane protein EcfT [Bradyrhizobium sp. ISRA464]